MVCKRRSGIFLVILARLCVVLPAWTTANAQYADAQRGAELLRERQCTACHPVAGQGGSAAPDLSRRSQRDFSEATLTALLWNHGPRMWETMRAREMEAPRLSEEDMTHVYAYFYSLRYFDPPGDAARGQRVFENKHCAHCHALTAGRQSSGPPVERWKTLGDPVLRLQEMWNHGTQMADEMDRAGLAWPNFSVQEMVDLMVYLENLPFVKSRTPTLRMGNPVPGKEAFAIKGCVHCHTLGEREQGKIDLLKTSRQERQLTGLAVELWNHRPRMERAAKARQIELQRFQGDEMADLVAYLFERGYFGASGSARRGARLLQAKSCNACHGASGSGAPDLRATGKLFSPIRLAAGVWRHGPAMLAEMRKRSLLWPLMTDQDVVDLVTYLNSE